MSSFFQSPPGTQRLAKNVSSVKEATQRKHWWECLLSKYSHLPTSPMLSFPCTGSLKLGPHCMWLMTSCWPSTSTLHHSPPGPLTQEADMYGQYQWVPLPLASGWFLPVESSDRRLKGRRKLNSKYFCSDSLPSGTPWVRCFPHQKVSMILKVALFPWFSHGTKVMHLRISSNFSFLVSVLYTHY